MVERPEECEGPDRCPVVAPHRRWLEMWRSIALVLATACLTGVGAWLSLGRQQVSRDEVARMILQQSPYALDRQLLLDRTEKVEDLARTVEGIARSQAETRLLLAVMARKDGISLPPGWSGESHQHLER